MIGVDVIARDLPQHEFVQVGGQVGAQYTQQARLGHQYPCLELTGAIQVLQRCTMLLTKCSISTTCGS